MRWKNGGGETTEIAVSPDGAALDTFDWRVSMAKVGSNGPFSLFPGIDRTLAVLDGNGIRLRVAGLGQRDLTPTDAPFAFPADVEAGADLIDGPIVDLNVMSRRDVVRHRLTRVAVDTPRRFEMISDSALLLIQGGGSSISAPNVSDSATPFGDGDSILMTKDDPFVVVTPGSALTIYLCEFWQSRA